MRVLAPREPCWGDSLCFQVPAATAAQTRGRTCGALDATTAARTAVRVACHPTAATVRPTILHGDDFHDGHRWKDHCVPDIRPCGRRHSRGIDQDGRVSGGARSDTDEIVVRDLQQVVELPSAMQRQHNGELDARLGSDWRATARRSLHQQRPVFTTRRPRRVK